MSRDTCRMPNCEAEPGDQTDRDDYRTSMFCSVQHDVKYEHLKADARDAKADARDARRSEARE